MLDLASPLRRLPHMLLVPALLMSSFAAAPTYAAKAPKFADSCESYRKPFKEIKNYQLNKILGGAVKGALAGIGLAILQNMVDPEYQRDANGRVIVGRNGKAKKKGPDLLGGAVKGAAVGGLIGWFSSMKQNARNQAELQAAVAQGFSQDVDQFSTLPQKLADLGNCRRAQIFGVQTSFQRKEIDAQTARARIDSIEKWVAKDDELISKAAHLQTKTVSAYAQATAMADGQDPETVKQSETQILATLEAQSSAYEPAVGESYVDAQGTTVDVPPPIPPAAATEMRYVSARKGVNLRAQANTAAAVVKFLPHGTTVETRQSPVQGWLEASAGGVTGYIIESGLSAQPPRGQSRVAAAPRPAPPRPTPPPPEKAAKKLVVKPARKQPSTPRERANQAAANNMSFARLVTQDKEATAAQIRAARRAYES